jgi:predicted dehydrogenase
MLLGASLVWPAGAGAAGEWVGLLDAGDLRAFRDPTGEWRPAASVTPSAADPRRLATTPGKGVIVNGDEGRTSDLLTRQELGDAEVHVEFLVPRGSNSGVYLMGRYEVQILDSFGVERGDYPGNECGGLYPRWLDEQNVGGRSPRANASRPAGEWQSFDIVFRAPRFDARGRKIAHARFVKVMHNGVLVHENAEVTGPTRAARFEREADEGPAGPLQLQGDHGPVAYRNLRIRPLRLDETPSRLALGIAGLSHSHVHGLLRRGGTDVRIVGIAEPNRELAVRYARRYGLDEALLFGSLEEMLARAGPEAVAAFGSTDEHRAVVEACAPRGIHVMVEKPLAFDSREALAMRSLAEKHHVHLLANLETTWYPSVHAVGTLVESGAVGEIRKVVVHDGHRGPKEIGVDPEFLAWLTDPVRNGGGALTDFGCYGANLMTWLMKGEAPLTVTAVTQRIKPAIYPRVDDEATIVLTYPRAQAILQASWNWPASRKDMEVYGERGYALAPDRGTIRLRRQEDAPEEVSPAPALTPPLDDPFAYLAGVVRGRVPVAPADLSALGNNVTVARILDAARESARTGRTVRLGNAEE